MPQIGTSGSMSGEWKRGDWPTASSYRATPRLYLFFCMKTRVNALFCMKTRVNAVFCMEARVNAPFCMKTRVKALFRSPGLRRADQSHYRSTFMIDWCRCGAVE